MNSKTAVIGGVALVALLVAYYFLSPFLLLRSLANAARTSDRDVLALDVDFPSVREGLKSQFNAFVLQKATADKEMVGNPFAGLAMMLVPAIVDRAVDGYVTPDGLAAVLRNHTKQAATGGATPALWHGDFSYLDPDHFRASYSSAEHPEMPLRLLLERRGMFGWKLVRIDMPLDEFDKASNKTQGLAAVAELPSSAARDVAQTPPPENNIPDAIGNVLPTRINQCSETTVAKVTTRLQDGNTGEEIAGSGSAVRYSNGGYQVSYDEILGINGSMPGDPVRLCLTAIPENCPPGDNRGRVYHAVNLRTHEEWDAPDAEHSCGGA